MSIKLDCGCTMEADGRVTVRCRECAYRDMARDGIACANDADACHTACLAAGLSPSALAADPECIKRVVEAAINVRANYPQRVAMMPHVKALDTALRAIGKEQA